MLHALQFFFFFIQRSASISQQHLPYMTWVKSNQDQQGRRNDWQKAVCCCPGQLRSHYCWDVHNKAQPWNVDREQSLLRPLQAKKQGWLNIWCLICKWCWSDHQIHTFIRWLTEISPAHQPWIQRHESPVVCPRRCVTSLGNNRSITAACDSTVLTVLWVISHIRHSRKSTGAKKKKKKITFMMVEFRSVAPVFSLLLVMVTHCRLFMVDWETWTERGQRYRH